MACRAYLVLVLIIFGLPSRAVDHPIVYGARYYAPPGSRVTTHFHLYRINPDGTGRRQITFGRTDDTNPLWSPDGRRVLFLRNGSPAVLDVRTQHVRALQVFHAVLESPSGHERLVAGAGEIDPASSRWLNGGRTVMVAQNLPWFVAAYDVLTGKAIRSWWGNSLATPSPDGKLVYLDRVTTTAGPRHELVSTYPDMPTDKVCWDGNKTLICYDEEALLLRIQPLRGASRTVDLVRPGLTHAQSIDVIPEGDLVGVEDGRAYLVANTSNSTVRPDNSLYSADLTTGIIHAIAVHKQFLAIAPDGRRFCTSPGRSLATYERHRYRLPAEGFEKREYRTVWTAPLQVGDLKTSVITTISKGQVWVVGADWR